MQPYPGIGCARGDCREDPRQKASEASQQPVDFPWWVSAVSVHDICRDPVPGPTRGESGTEHYAERQRLACLDAALPSASVGSAVMLSGLRLLPARPRLAPSGPCGRARRQSRGCSMERRVAHARQPEPQPWALGPQAQSHTQVYVEVARARWKRKGQRATRFLKLGDARGWQSCRRCGRILHCDNGAPAAQKCRVWMHTGQESTTPMRIC